MKRQAAAIVRIVGVGFLFFGSLPCAAQQQNDGVSSRAAQSKPIPISVKVEAEGGGKGQGMWAQAATDPTPSEVNTLQTLVVTEMKKQEGVKIVPLDYPQDCIGIAVVAAKVPNGATHKLVNGKLEPIVGAGTWYVASSVVTIATKKGIDELVTHDVVAASDLASLARTIGYQFAVARFRAVSSLWK